MRRALCLSFNMHPAPKLKLAGLLQSVPTRDTELTRIVKSLPPPTPPHPTTHPDKPKLCEKTFADNCMGMYEPVWPSDKVFETLPLSVFSSNIDHI